MRATYRKKYTAVIMAVVLAVLLVGCNVPTNQGNLTLNKQQALEFLTECQTDVDTMNGVAAKINVFLEEDSLDEDDGDIEATIQEMQVIREELSPILNANTELYPPESPLAQYTLLRLRCARDLDDVLVEIQEILNYEMELLYAFEPLEELEYLDYNDLEAVYEQLGVAYTEINQRTVGITPPTFLQYMHEGLCEGLNDYLDAMQSLIVSVYYDDPLLTNSDEYQLGVLERKMDILLDEGEQAFDRREAKIKEDVEEIHTMLDGMADWVSSNDQAIGKSNGMVIFSEMAPVLTARLDKEQVYCLYEAPDTIIPANYRSLDYIVFLSTWCDNGTTDVIVSVEIPEFTQKYVKKITLSRAETQIKIHPPLLEGAAKSLNSSKDAQINISVTDADTGKVELQESHPLKIYSRYDMQWAAEDGTPYYENVLAWVTPEAPEVKELLREAADSISYISDGDITFIGGYQSVSGYDDENLAAYQAVAVMNALAESMEVKYVATPFSSSNNNFQRVATPSEVIDKRSGLCIETALTVASALQATGMHAALIILPTHAQVAVETWYGTGDYYIIETTALDDARAGNFDYVLAYFTKDEWEQYIMENNATIIDCDLAQTLGIQSID